jgi:C1A family cysteine protease
MEFKFMQYVAEHGKQYTDAAEYMLRFNIFQQTEDFINMHNASGETHTVGHNFMSDWTVAERSNLLGLKNMPRQAPKDVKIYPAPNGDSKNWVDDGAVTPVKDQGQCGSCWSFSATGGLEGAYFVAGNTLTSFSEEQLVECAGLAYGNMACYGGWYYSAWDYLKSNEAMTEDDYPYTSGNGGWSTCEYDSSVGVTNVKSYAAVTSNDPDQLAAAIDTQPVSVAIEADKLVFQFYSSGVITGDSCGTTLDHAVLAVGYGTEDGTDYFLVKNSWAETWGDAGYVKIGRTSGSGVCGINEEPYTVTV